MTTRLTILAAAVATALVAVAVATGGGHRVRVVSTAKDASLGKTVLVTTAGRTLYRLSAERKGRFICTDSTCLGFWHPLTVAAHATPTGVAGLGTVRRPDGRRQVTYRGGPLYTFSGDDARGDAKGEGLKDVGVWHAAVLGRSAPTTTGGGGGYHY